MKRPVLFEIDYQHDRRKHRHRCQCCNKIVAEGERVIMYPVSHKATRVLHVSCADKQSFELTYRELAQAHCDAYARRLGHMVAGA